MATYVVTTSNWNQPGFWSAIDASNGDTLDLSALGAAYSFDFDRSTSVMTISDGVTSFTIGNAGSAGTDAQLGSGVVDDFDVQIGTAGDDSFDLGDETQNVSGGDGSDTIFAGGGADTLDGGADADLLMISDIATGKQLHGGESVTTGSDDDTLDASGFTATGIEFTFNADEGGFLGDGTNNGRF